MNIENAEVFLLSTQWLLHKANKLDLQFLVITCTSCIKLSFLVYLHHVIHQHVNITIEGDRVLLSWIDVNRTKLVLIFIHLRIRAHHYPQLILWNCYCYYQFYQMTGPRVTAKGQPADVLPKHTYKYTHNQLNCHIQNQKRSQLVHPRPPIFVCFYNMSENNE